MPQHLHLDFETFSKVDLREVGAYRYAFDPSTEILCAAMAFDGDEGEEPAVWTCQSSALDLKEVDDYFDALEDPSVLIYAHHAQFEIAISQALMWKTWGIRPPDIGRWRCTLSLARRASLPGKLEKLAEVLKLQHLKDKRGKALIKKFSMMQPAKRITKKNPSGVPPRRIKPGDDPQAFAEFVEYCRQDVRTEQEVSHRLTYFDEPINNRNYTLHEIINARGVTVNLSALHYAQRLIDEETEIVSQQFRELTGFEVTQNARLLKWVNAYSNLNLDNLQAETVEDILENQQHQISGMVDRALRMKQSIAYASIKKVATMLACAGPQDNRIRGMLNHHGATTGRSTNSLVQFQNMKRPTIPNSEESYGDICGGISRGMLEISHGPVLEVISSCIRHFVQDTREQDCFREDGSYATTAIFTNPLLDADYSAIEARIVCWLAGQQDALDEYREGVKRYERMAALIYGVAEADVNKFPQRFVGKEATLGCGFGLGADRFRKQCLKRGYELPEGLEFRAVKSWRAKHKKVVKFWDILDDAAQKAVINKGQVFHAGRFIQFKCRDIEGLPFLLMKLPSGRKLAYPQPKIVPGNFEGTTAVSFFANLKGTMWGHMSVWGGVWCENGTQAVAADIMCHGAQNAEDAGYEIASLIHDQALAYHQPRQTSDEFVRLLTDLPPWADGLPVEAEGSLVPFYKKD